MCGRLDVYLLAFSKLRTNKDKNLWSRLTWYREPYTPFLLLSVLDHIGTGAITRNFISPNFELEQTFLGYTDLLPPADQNNNKTDMAYPFYNLRSADFWELIAQPEQKHQKDKTTLTLDQLQTCYFGARLSKDLFMLLQMEHSRKKFYEVLISTYFMPEIQHTIQKHTKA